MVNEESAINFSEREIAHTSMFVVVTTATIVKDFRLRNAWWLLKNLEVSCVGDFGSFVLYTIKDPHNQGSSVLLI